MFTEKDAGYQQKVYPPIRNFYNIERSKLLIFAAIKQCDYLYGNI